MNVRVVCVGGGYWGRNLIRNFHGLSALAGICDSSAQIRAEAAQLYPDVKLFDAFADVLRDNDIDAVVIATPAATHGALVRQALVAGKDVFVEKPLCLSVREGEELVALARQHSRVLMVGHLLWYHPAILKLKELIHAGELGRLQYAYSNRLNLGKIRREENILWSFAPHDISVILGLFGETPDSVSAAGGKYLHGAIEDVTVSLLSFPSGLRAHIFVSWLHPFKEQKLVLVGDRQMAVFDDVEKTNKLTLYPHSIKWQDNVPVANKADGIPVPLESVEPLRAECQHFIDCVVHRATPRTDGEEALRVLRVLHDLQVYLDRPSMNGTQNQEKPQVQAQPPYFVHESSYVDDGVQIGDGTTIWHFSHVLKNSRIGRQCRIGQNVVIGPNAVIGNGVKIQNNVSVYEGVELEDNVFCGPSMVFTNVYNPRSAVPRMSELRRTLVRRGATLGANCTVVCGITIGEYAFIGAGAVVLRDVPNYALVVGNPGRVVGYMCSCGERIDFTADVGGCRVCATRYRKAGEEVVPIVQVGLVPA